MLDEIGDLPLALQSKLLRFLQERKVERLGGRQEIAVDVRVVCATHQNLKAQIAEGRFREDLYYRLAEIVVEIPALRDRTGDAVLLAHAFLRRFAQEQKRGALAFSEDALKAIETHPWSGNVRQLLSAVRRAVIMADGNRVCCEDLGLVRPADDDVSAEQTAGAGTSDLDLRRARETAERTTVVTAIARTNGNLAKAAELLGVSRPTLYDLMRRLAIQ
jgi:two-component system NtrC family response regulator